jgi:hypothetical protein
MGNRRGQMLIHGMIVSTYLGGIECITGDNRLRQCDSWDMIFERLVGWDRWDRDFGSDGWLGHLRPGFFGSGWWDH